MSQIDPLQSGVFEDPFQQLCIPRFLRYVTVDTQADETSDTYPSSPGQWNLLRLLHRELVELGLDEVEIDEHGYVTATLPATVPATADADLPVVAFLAHVDTSPDMPGQAVKPLLHRNYDGSVLHLPDHADAVLDPAEHDDLRAAVGHDLITASGATLLGGDDKAGVAEIMAALEYLKAHPEIPHGNIRVAFTPDEEIGLGVEHFDVEAFGADFAYTLDGGGHGRVECETFSADSARLTFVGFNTHPGYAKGKMVNSLKVACDFVGRLPKDAVSPETTAGHEPYLHPNDIRAAVDRSTVHLLLRAFDDDGLAALRQTVQETADAAVAAWPGSQVEVEFSESYRNMKPVVDRHPQVMAAAERAMARVGLELKQGPIRGGTDGSRLSHMGLPCPNLSSGQHAIHSRVEWVDVWEMGKAVELIVEIAKVVAEGVVAEGVVTEGVVVEDGAKLVAEDAGA